MKSAKSLGDAGHQLVDSLLAFLEGFQTLFLVANHLALLLEFVQKFSMFGNIFLAV